VKIGKNEGIGEGPLDLCVLEKELPTEAMKRVGRVIGSEIEIQTRREKWDKRPLWDRQKSKRVKRGGGD